jgi:hypothetical protein
MEEHMSYIIFQTITEELVENMKATYINLNKKYKHQGINKLTYNKSTKRQTPSINV